MPAVCVNHMYLSLLFSAPHSLFSHWRAIRRQSRFAPIAGARRCRDSGWPSSVAAAASYAESGTKRRPAVRPPKGANVGHTTGSGSCSDSTSRHSTRTETKCKGSNVLEANGGKVRMRRYAYPDPAIIGHWCIRISNYGLNSVTVTRFTLQAAVAVIF